MTGFVLIGAPVSAGLGLYIWGLQHLCAYAHPEQVKPPPRIDALLYALAGANAGAIAGFFGWLGSL